MADGRERRRTRGRDEQERRRTRGTRAPRPDRSERPSKPAVVPANASITTVRRDGALPGMRAPVMLVTEPDEDHALLDSGDGLKLEQYGEMRVVRPEAQALWPPRLKADEWQRADAVFTGETDERSDEESKGRWAFPNGPRGDVWPMAHDGIAYHGRLTAFRHMGVFPEQAAHWRWMEERLRPGDRVLNLFAYTGLASLAAARAGAEVTHVDASKKAIGWARENAAQAGLSERPVRWICEDASRFVEREGRRGKTYDLILLDPPKFGRGPNGEVWELFEHLPGLLSACRDILSPRPLGIVLTAYAVRASFFALHGLMGETMRGMGGTVESGELTIRERGDEARLLPTSLFSRWVGR